MVWGFFFKMRLLKENNNGKLMFLLFLLSVISLAVICSDVCEAHILIIGDSLSDDSHMYSHALEANRILKSQGYSTVLLTRKSATKKAIISNMKNADAVIYIGHGVHRTGSDSNGYTSPPYGIAASDGTIWSVGDKLSYSSDGSNGFKAPLKKGALFMCVHTCYSVGRAGNVLFKNPSESAYYFSLPYVSAGAKYYATGSCTYWKYALQYGGTRSFNNLWFIYKSRDSEFYLKEYSIDGRGLFLVQHPSVSESYWSGFIGSRTSSLLFLPPKAKSDLDIVKVYKSGNYYRVQIKNIGNKKVTRNFKISVSYAGRRYVRWVTKDIKPGATLTYSVKLPKKYANKRYKKSFYVDYKNLIAEKNEKNNAYVLKR